MKNSRKDEKFWKINKQSYSSIRDLRVLVLPNNFRLEFLIWDHCAATQRADYLVLAPLEKFRALQ